MYIDRVLLKTNAKNTLFRGYWSCMLTGLVLALATGMLGNAPSTKNYSFSNSGNMNGNYFGAEIRSYDPSEVFGNIFGTLDLPTYLIGTLFSILVVAIVISLLLAIFLLQPLEVGCRKFYIDARNDDYNLSDMGEAFSENYTNIVKIMFLRSLYTFLWSLLFLIPGLVKSYEYRMIPYILAENPDISDRDAFLASRQMMMGSKFDAFVFDLSFLGWFLLDAITFGLLGIFYVNPYYFNACTELYAFVKAKPVYGSSYDNSAYNNSYASGNYQNSGYQDSSYQNGYGYQAPADGYQAGQTYQPAEDSGQTYQPPADTGRETGLSQQEGSTTSADDAKPFRVPYGQ